MSSTSPTRSLGSTGRVELSYSGRRRSSSLFSIQSAESEDVDDPVRRSSSKWSSTSSFNRAAWVVLPSPAPETNHAELGVVSEEGWDIVCTQRPPESHPYSTTGNSASSALAHRSIAFTESPKQMANDLPDQVEDGSATASDKIANLVNAVSIKDGVASASQELPTRPHRHYTDSLVASDLFSGSRVVQRKALLIGVQCSGPASEASQTQHVVGAHRDIYGMRDLLIDIYHYVIDNITILIDDNIPGNAQPTRDAILKAIDNFVADVGEGDKLLFLFAGHGMQQDCDENDLTEEDGKDEFIIACDGKSIKDNELRARLVDKLHPGSSLNAFFDCCHSGTILDLDHYRCNRVWVPWCNKGVRRTKTLWETNGRKRAFDRLQSFSSVIREASPESKNAERVLYYDDPSHTEFRARILSPEPLFCDGFCRTQNNYYFGKQSEPTAEVICLSSSKDAQKTWEDAEGNSMTQYLIEMLRNEPHPTYKKLLINLSHSIHALYTGLHTNARAYKKAVAKYMEEHKHEKIIVHQVEMHNFQNPEISTHHPLDMFLKFDP